MPCLANKEYDSSETRKNREFEMSAQNMNDPMAMITKLWGNMGFGLPGIVVPTFDSDELEKRISDLKAVEGWLSMNLSMLQMTIRSLEMQKSTINAVRSMGEMASSAANNAAQAMGESNQAMVEALKGEARNIPAGEPAAGAENEQLWPWGIMQQVQEYMQRHAAELAAATAAEGAGQDKAAKKPRSRKEKPE